MSRKSQSQLDREKRQRRGEGDRHGSSTSSGKSYKSANDRNIGGILDHVHRVCFRPTVPTNLQVEVAKKLGFSRKLMARGAKSVEIAKPLYDLVYLFNQLGYDISQVVSNELNEINSSMKKTVECFEDDGPSSMSLRSDLEGNLLKKRLKLASKNIKALSDMTDIKVIINDAADRIRRGRPFSKSSALQKEKEALQVDLTEEALQIVDAMDGAKFSPDLSTQLNVCMARTRRALHSHSGCLLLRKPLHSLRDAVRANHGVEEALKEIHNTIDSYDNFQRATSISV